MFCPQCAAQNNDGVKFCRKCGMELEAVALVLSDMSAQTIEVGGKRSEAKTTQEWLVKRSEAVKEISTGLSLLVVSVLIGLAMAFFVPSHIPWILAWAVLVGWMACWGGIAVGNGIAGVLEAKNRLRLPGMAGKESAVDATTNQLSSAGQPPMVTNPSPAFGSFPPSSVTEGTTRQLDELDEK
ncbi:MAG: zinc-ribbon domain-containing protein [Pyrinomonadaceae bacterium]|nr:zinc-ribbon domain-containing protein [Pyrinomonadaceae bacterium]